MPSNYFLIVPTVQGRCQGFDTGVLIPLAGGCWIFHASAYIFAVQTESQFKCLLINILHGVQIVHLLLQLD